MHFNITLLLLFLLTAPGAVAQDRFIGYWQNSDKLVVQLYEQESQYYAKVIDSKDPETIGKVVVMQMEKKSDSRLFGGTYQDAGDHQEYEARLTLLSETLMKMKVITGIFTKTIFWHRVAPHNQDAPLLTALQRH